MKYELRGKIKFFTDGKETINLIVRDETGGDYQTWEYPTDRALTVEEIAQFLSKVLECDPADISFPKHILPQLEKKK